MPQAIYAIRHFDDDQLFWNPKLGWVETERETRYSKHERETAALPLHGVWVLVL